MNEVFLKNFEHYNVLVIDDEAAILEVLEIVLTNKGMKVDTAENGAEGIRKIESNDYDIIITDIKMPGISGEKVLAEVKRIKGDTLPVIGMSGTPWLLDANLFDAVLSKPYTREDLFEVIKMVAPFLLPEQQLSRKRADGY